MSKSKYTYRDDDGDRLEVDVVFHYGQPVVYFQVNGEDSCYLPMPEVRRLVSVLTSMRREYQVTEEE